ncbi:MAG: hypothetical protein AAGF07_01725 [Patescibacteria group bacterium]
MIKSFALFTLILTALSLPAHARSNKSYKLVNSATGKCLSLSSTRSNGIYPGNCSSSDAGLVFSFEDSFPDSPTLSIRQRSQRKNYISIGRNNSAYLTENKQFTFRILKNGDIGNRIDIVEMKGSSAWCLSDTGNDIAAIECDVNDDSQHWHIK